MIELAGCGSSVDAKDHSGERGNRTNGELPRLAGRAMWPRPHTETWRLAGPSPNLSLKTKQSIKKSHVNMPNETKSKDESDNTERMEPWDVDKELAEDQYRLG
jgi:hypothetical protein